MKQREQNGEAILHESRNCRRIVRAGRVAFLIDAEAYFKAFVETVRQAEHSIFILGWDINSRVRLMRDDQNYDLPTPLGEFLNAILDRRPDLHIYILCWDFAMIYAMEREFIPVFRFDFMSHRHLHFRYDGKHPPGASHHQKIVVVDDCTAFTGGIDITRCRWDTPEHLPDDPRRVDPSGRRYQPFHDAQVMVDGEAAAALGELARDRWRFAAGKRLSHGRRDGSDPWPSYLKPDMEDVRLGLAVTQAAYDGREELREVEALYCDAIAAARRFIYIENQYLTSSLIAERLIARLQEKDGPEIVLVLPKQSTGWLEQSTMDVLRARLIRKLRKEDRYGRLRVVYPAVPGLGDEHLHVHAKIMVVDDRLAIVGSANLSNRSMGLDTECDLVIESSGRHHTAAGIESLRNRLLAEHLDVTPETVGQILSEKGSLTETLDTLRGEGRTLEPISDELPQWMEDMAPPRAVFDPECPVSAEELSKEFIPEEAPAAEGGSLWRLASILAVMLAFAAVWRWTPLNQLIDLETLHALAERIRAYPGSPLLVIGGYIIGCIVFFPVTLMIVVTAMIFDPIAGFASSIAGCLLGAVANYATGRFIGRDILRRLAGERLNRLSRRLGRYGLVTVISLRILPILPFTMFNLIAGASHIRLRDYLIGTLLGMGPGIFAMTVFGNRLKVLVMNPSVESFAVLAGIGVFLIAGVVTVRWWVGRMKRRNSGKVEDAS